MKSPSPLPTQFVDRPDLLESFADTLEKISVDGETVRLEFCTDRLQDPKAGGQPAVTRQPSVRIVMPLSGGIAMTNKLVNLFKAMEAQQAKVLPGLPVGKKAN